MNMQFKAMNFPELTFKLNPLPSKDNLKFEIKPRFERQIRVSNENPHIYIVNLICSIVSTIENPNPFDMRINISGVFEVDEIENINKKLLAKTSTQFLFPYLRSAISSLTATANITPIHLPLLNDGILFPEDRDVQTTLTND